MLAGWWVPPSLLSRATNETNKADLFLFLPPFSLASPSLIANLWDVTDRDIDRLSEAVFLTLDLQASSILRASSSSSSSGSKTTTTRKKKGKTTAQAVGEARDKCKLRFLTGAAVVVYGVPVRFV